MALVLATSVQAACVTEPDLKIRIDTPPPLLPDGWAISTPTAEGFDEVGMSRALDRFFSDTLYLNAVSLIVARNGRLVVEAYARGEGDRARKRNIQSGTKSVTSLVFGVARARGYFPDLDQTLYSILPEAFDDDPEKRRITLRHLLTMRSGIDLDNEDFSSRILDDRPPGQARRILAHPLFAAPGAVFDYRDADPQLLSSAVQGATGSTLEELARDAFFGKLGITDYYWEANVDGTSLGAVALFLRPRDFAKIGQLALDRGAWNGEQVVPEEWLVESTSPHTPTGLPAFDYGYYWWICPELGAFTAVGHGGQFAFAVPGKDLLIVMTSLPSTDDDTVGTTLDEFLSLARVITESAQG